MVIVAAFSWNSFQIELNWIVKGFSNLGRCRDEVRSLFSHTPKYKIQMNKTKAWLVPRKRIIKLGHIGYIYIIFRIKKWGIKRFPMILRSKYERNWNFELILDKTGQNLFKKGTKCQISEFSSDKKNMTCF